MSAHKKNSLFRRLIYFVVMLVTGGGAGVGGWAFKDHPRIQALIGMVTGKAEDSAADGADLEEQADLRRRGRAPGRPAPAGAVQGQDHRDPA